MNQRLEYMALEKESQGSGSNQIFVEKNYALYVVGLLGLRTRQLISTVALSGQVKRILLLHDNAKSRTGDLV